MLNLIYKKSKQVRQWPDFSPVKLHIVICPNSRQLKLIKTNQLNQSAAKSVVVNQSLVYICQMLRKQLFKDDFNWIAWGLLIAYKISLIWTCANGAAQHLQPFLNLREFSLLYWLLLYCRTLIYTGAVGGKPSYLGDTIQLGKNISKVGFLVHFPNNKSTTQEY